MSDARRDPNYVLDILEATRRIIAYTEGITYAEFLDDIKTQDAVLRNMQVIGEAVKKLSTAFKKAHPEIPWRQMAGMRDKIVHDYPGINYDVVWTVARQELPNLESQIADF